MAAAVTRSVFSPAYARLQDWLVAGRHAEGLTQAQLAEWLGVNRQTVIALEQGGPVSVTVAVKAIALLGGKLVVAPKGAIIAERDPSS